MESVFSKSLFGFVIIPWKPRDVWGNDSCVVLSPGENEVSSGRLRVICLSNNRPHAEAQQFYSEFRGTPSFMSPPLSGSFVK